jgi:hypothetical protein
MENLLKVTYLIIDNFQVFKVFSFFNQLIVFFS